MTRPPDRPLTRPAARPPEKQPLYVRRPFLAGLIRQLPLLAVLVVVGAGLLLVTFEHWRRGLVVMGVALLIGAALRLLLPLRRVGFLAVRSRFVDVLTLGGAGLALVVIASAIPSV
jgi:Protein of unknown function (DUF3017)